MLQAEPGRGGWVSAARRWTAIFNRKALVGLWQESMQVRRMSTEVKKTRRGHEMHLRRPHVSLEYFNTSFNNLTHVQANFRIKKRTRDEGKALKQNRLGWNGKQKRGCEDPFALCRSYLWLKHCLAIMLLYSLIFSVETEARKERRHARQKISMHTETHRDTCTCSPAMQHRNFGKERRRWTYSGPLAGLVGHAEGLVALHTWKRTFLNDTSQPAGGAG